jgi:peptidoglycan/xylan/chitin deacetylase (PgdA/CDA1 family)
MRLFNRILVTLVLAFFACTNASFAHPHPNAKKANTTVTETRSAVKAKKARPPTAKQAPKQSATAAPLTKTEVAPVAPTLNTFSVHEALRILERPPIAPLVPKSVSTSPALTQAAARYQAIPERNAFHVFSYHDVYPSIAEKQAVGGDADAITVETMVRHFSWLRDNGYAVVSMQQVIDARNGGKPLPPKAVMITFDDGYKSFHQHVLPVLKLFDYPAVLAVIGKWIDDPQSAVIEYEATRVVSPQFMSWDEIRDCLDSGLVEIASHSHDLHHGHLGNPQGNKQPAAITRRFDPTNARYESEREYAERVRADLFRNSETLKRRVGVQPRIIVWPYGAYNATTQQIAVELGMPIGLTLDPGVNSDESSLAAISRDLVSHLTENFDVAYALRSREIKTQRVVTVNVQREFVDYSSGNERPLSLLLERVLNLKPTIVILSVNGQQTRAYNDNARSAALEFGGTRSNVLNRIAWQLRTRAGVRVFVDDPGQNLSAEGRVAALTELGRYNHFAGLVRDAAKPHSPSLDSGFLAVANNHPTLESMVRMRFDIACGEALPQAKETRHASARNERYAMWREAVAFNHWLLLQVRTSAHAKCNLKWWQSLAQIAATMPDWQQRTIIEIDNDIDADTSANVVRPLLDAYAAGFRHYGYANDDARNDRPEAQLAKRAISVENHPVRQR